MKPELPLTTNGTVTGPEPWETGFKDTVIAYPGQVTRIKATFATPGQYVWHCHIVEHEDNEMMRPYRIGPEQPGPAGLGHVTTAVNLTARPSDRSWVTSDRVAPVPALVPGHRHLGSRRAGRHGDRLGRGYGERAWE